MARGGARAGAGRPKGAKAKLSMRGVAAIVAEGIAPLDVYKRVVPRLEELAMKSDDPMVACAVLDRVAKFRKLFHSEFAATDAPARPHASQGLPLFDGPESPPAGKKEAAEQAAHSAAQGPGWGDLLKTRVN